MQGQAERLYEDILARTGSTRKRNSVTNVWRALEHLRSMRSADLGSYAAVGRAIEALGRTGPKVQSIRNAEGRDCRELIDAYAAEHGAPQRERRQLLADELAATIPDLRTAALVRATLNENTSLKRRLDPLKEAFGKLAPVDVSTLSGDPARAAEGSGPRPAPQPPAAMLTAKETAALADFLTSIEENGSDLEIGFDADSGALPWRGVLELAGPGFRQALEKMTGAPP